MKTITITADSTDFRWACIRSLIEFEMIEITLRRAGVVLKYEPRKVGNNVIDLHLAHIAAEPASRQNIW